MTQVTIQGETFEIATPYVAGPIELSEAEAATLNQTRIENIRNNLAGKIKSLKEKNLSLDSAAEGDEQGRTYRAIFTEYADSYEFGVRAASTREPVDPVQREARRIAKEMLAGALKAKGVKVKDLDPDKYEAMVATVAARDEVQKEAKRRTKSVADIGLEALGLGDETAQPEAA